ncbi:SSI family serine proteinase inhibitor [Pseudonocardia sediminis]|uniref:SSI family serine proteinase inhibitor n=1 Tax=Pseudonocardia sediminis TaxID=1397368 RepID=UPI001A91C9B9|nr:SSI family serine proteinase inhibitor [Pseudonocardia sediminis]
MSDVPGRVLTVLRRRGWITVVALLALVGLVAGLLTYLVPLAFAATSAAGGTRLQVVVAGSGTQDGTVTLDCADDDATDRAACDRLDEMARTGGASAFEPVPADAMCTMQFGGPETAEITGTWDGRPVDASFTRSGGCEIERWEALEPVLPTVAS